MTPSEPHSGRRVRVAGGTSRSTKDLLHGVAGSLRRRQQAVAHVLAAHAHDRIWHAAGVRACPPQRGITGFTNFEFSIGGKWLELLKECAPSTGRIAVLFQPANPTWAPYLRTIEAAAPSFGLQLIPAGVRDAAEITQRIAAFARDPNGAVVVLPSLVTLQHRRSIIGATAMQRLPAMYPYPFFTVDGGSTYYRLRSLERYQGAL